MDKEQKINELREKLAVAEPSEVGGILTELCGIEEGSLLYNKILALSEEK